MKGSVLKRGQVVWVDLDPALGSEAAGRRPALVISSDENNAVMPTLTVAPLTSSVKRIYPFEVFVDANKFGLHKDSDLQKKLGCVAQRLSINRPEAIYSQRVQHTLVSTRIARKWLTKTVNHFEICPKGAVAAASHAQPRADCGPHRTGQRHDDAAG